MAYQSMFAISAAGMNAERMRMEISALNIANAHTAIEPGSEGFAPRRAVLIAAGKVAHGARTGGFAAQAQFALTGPAVGIERTAVAQRRVLEPGHPFADAAGMVAYPAVDITAETLIAITA